MQLKWLAMIPAAGFCLVTTVYASSAPDQTGAFVNYCADKRNLKECRGKMMMIEFREEVGSNPGLCTVPEGISSQKANERILQWLGSHRAYDDKPLHDGMQAAMRDLWQCATKLNSGATLSKAPDTTEEFLAFCSVKENAEKCAAEIETDYGVAVLDRKGGCNVPAGITPRELMDKTLQWLQTHQQPAGERTETAVIAAMAGVWPCH